MEEKITAWVARDECDLYLHIFYANKPHKDNNLSKWTNESNFYPEYAQLLKHELYPQVKWEDEEPTEVELTIKIKE